MAVITPTDSDYASRLQGIRLFVNNQYGPDDLSDTTIENDVFLGSANREVARLVPGYDGLSADDKNDIKVATQEICAAEILQSELETLSDELKGRTVRTQGIQIQNRILALRASATTKINRIAPAADTEESLGVVYEVLC